jgi:hypothetical protein
MVHTTLTQQARRLQGPGCHRVAGDFDDRLRCAAAEALAAPSVLHSEGLGGALRVWRLAQVMTEGGPWHARKLQSGEEFMERLGRRFLARCGGPGDEQRGRRLVHSPFARLVVLRRAAGSEGGASSSAARSCL